MGFAQPWAEVVAPSTFGVSTIALLQAQYGSNDPAARGAHDLFEGPPSAAHIGIEARSTGRVSRDRHQTGLPGLFASRYPPNPRAEASRRLDASSDWRNAV